MITVLALSACGGSSGGGGGGALSGSLTQPGLFGKLPPPGTPTHGGTITYGLLNGSTTPNYIFPIVPSGNASTSNYAWQQSMWLPLYNNFAYGSAPGIDYPFSIGNAPTFSDGNKTVTITMKSGYKWNDGKPVTAQDLLFDIALVKAAVKESAANWGSYTPGYFPDSLASTSAPSANTVVLHLTKAFNPGFFLNNQLALNLYPLPSQDWNVASAGGAHPDRHELWARRNRKPGAHQRLRGVGDRQRRPDREVTRSLRRGRIRPPGRATAIGAGRGQPCSGCSSSCLSCR
jgi:peptide/nickel transport system substrate-binding protein